MIELDPTIYTEDYYRKHTLDPLLSDSEAFGQAVNEVLRPSCVYDFGCGVGAVLAGLGYDVLALGYEHPTARKIIMDGGLNVIHPSRIQPWDVTRMAYCERFFAHQIAICVEVAEHLPAALAYQLVKHLCAKAPTIVFSAAIPGQGGEGHLNEQRPEYWVERFKEGGRVVDRKATDLLREKVRETVKDSFWYYTVTVFRTALE